MIIKPVFSAKPSQPEAICLSVKTVAQLPHRAIQMPPETRIQANKLVRREMSS